jgi:hypothetical protein
MKYSLLLVIPTGRSCSQAALTVAAQPVSS